MMVGGGAGVGSLIVTRILAGSLLTIVRLETFWLHESIAPRKAINLPEEDQQGPRSTHLPIRIPHHQGIAQDCQAERGFDPAIQPFHVFRKFFESCLDRPGLDVDKKRQLEGHSLGVRFHYTDRDVDQFRGLYEQAYHFLDLSEEAVADSRIKDSGSCFVQGVSGTVQDNGLT